MGYMMLIASLVLASQGGAQANEAASLVSKMLAYYNDAKTYVGTIRMVQTAGNKQAIVTTELQAELPAKLYLKQELKASYGTDSWLVTSNGVYFSYDPPEGVEGRRLVEPVEHARGNHDVRSIYAAVVKSIYDRSTPLDIVIGRIADLRYRNLQWVNVKLQGETQIGEDTVTVVGGQWREYGSAPASGTYTMAIDGQSRLRRFTISEKVGVNAGGQQIVQQVDTVWEVNVQKDVPVRQELFNLVR